MQSILDLVMKSAGQVWLSLVHNWPYLLLSIVIAVILRRSIDATRVSAFLRRHKRAGVVAATAVAVGTPLCSCGTTAVVLGMMAGSMPWAPIVAFMVASPLTSPEGMIYSAGLFGWPFAIAFMLASVLLGLAGGWITGWLEERGWLANQSRFTAPAPEPCGCSAPAKSAPAAGVFAAVSAPAATPFIAPEGCGCGAAAAVLPSPACVCDGSSLSAVSRASLCLSRFLDAAGGFAKDAAATGRQLLLMFVGFAFVGFVINGLIPQAWITGLFGSGNLYSVPLAATLGLPFYLNAEASLPLIRGLLDSGMSQGVALAFLIAGAGTSIGAVSGALTIARWRVVALVIVILWIGAIASGYAFDLLLALKLF